MKDLENIIQSCQGGIFPIYSLLGLDQKSLELLLCDKTPYTFEELNMLTPYVGYDMVRIHRDYFITTQDNIDKLSRRIQVSSSPLIITSQCKVDDFNNAQPVSS